MDLLVIHELVLCETQEWSPIKSNNTNWKEGIMERKVAWWEKLGKPEYGGEM